MTTMFRIGKNMKRLLLITLIVFVIYLVTTSLPFRKKRFSILHKNALELFNHKEDVHNVAIQRQAVGRNETQDELRMEEPIYEKITRSLTHHPFENSCKFPMPRTLANDITNWKYTERLRSLKCPIDAIDLATMDSEGNMYVHPHFAEFGKTVHGVYCKAVIIEGGLRNPTNNKGKNTIKEIAHIKVPENIRFFVNADAFIIRCENSSKTVVWEKPFPGLADTNLDLNKVYLTQDTPSFDGYGKVREVVEEKKSINERLSIDMLGFDSTARSMFYRHLPRTVETMKKLGFETLYGYNKVADNSIVNLAPILVGDIPEALQEPPLDAAGDVNIDWILPSHNKMDPTNLRFLWQIMKEKYGCHTMFNEDIGRQNLGLFNYPPEEFLPGFTRKPADHYFRAYYLAVYKNWSYKQCRNGKQQQSEYADLWRRFANKYKSMCHFGFTFVTTLTHDQSRNLEVMDEQLTSSFENLQFQESLNNTVMVVFGDHGNRIGSIQHTYTGRIEERMPMMSFYFPPWFKIKYSTEYNNFLENKYKLVSNFDIHQTLKDIVHMRFGVERHQPTQGRGISLFDKIPTNRSCSEAFIPKNFCSCLVDRSNVTSAFNNVPVKTYRDREHGSQQAVHRWLQNNQLLDCVKNSSITITSPLSILGINPLARHGLRTVLITEDVNKALNAEAKMTFFTHEFEVTATLRDESQSLINLLVRVDEEAKTKGFELVFEPSVRVAPPHCSYVSLFDVCKCMKRNIIT